MATFNLDTVIAALADKTRRSIVEQLVKGHAPVKELAIGYDMALPSFLKHLTILEKANVIQTEKIGRQRICTLNLEALKLISDWSTSQIGDSAIAPGLPEEQMAKQVAEAEKTTSDWAPNWSWS